MPFPRIRGGDPKTTTVNGMGIALFPAYAGVIPRQRKTPQKPPTFPRIRGGDPNAMLAELFNKYFSPHMRGLRKKNHRLN